MNWQSSYKKSLGDFTFDKIFHKFIPDKSNGFKACRFYSMTIKRFESVFIQIDPSNTDARSIEAVEISSSSIYIISPEIFTKFVNSNLFRARNVDIEEISSETFSKARNLVELRLSGNKLSHLPADVFKSDLLITFLNFKTEILL